MSVARLVTFAQRRVVESFGVARRRSHQREEFAVALLLHLSDLHLGRGDADEVFGDHKVELVPPEARERRSTTLASTLKALGAAIADSGEPIDAVVVSGDVAYRGSEEGFALLASALADLGAAAPAPERVMVVPGNHDVAWGTEPSSQKRYDAFLRGVRDRGYATPYLEGIDLDASGEPLPGVPIPVLRASDNSFLVLGLNSSNNCGVRVRWDDEVENAVSDLASRQDDPAAAIVARKFVEQSLHDVARVDHAQRQAASVALTSARARIEETGSSPIVFATMHHQLLPVTLDEEIKTFESLVNLGQFRDWLGLNAVDVLLHGHKHVSACYLDQYVPLANANSGGRGVLVSSVGTVGLGQGASGVVAKLYRTCPETPTLGRVDVVEVPASQAGVPIRLADLPRASYTLHTAQERGLVLSGGTVQAVHEQLLRLADDDQLVGPVTCRVMNPPGPGEVSPSLTRLPIPEGDSWFSEYVSTWQAPKRLQSMPFNHGERIKGDPDQLERAIQALRTTPDTSRAVISLLRPDSDDITDVDQEFPAFCLVQLMIVKDELRLIGYFRKQEMRYWWPINLAELSDIQERAIARMRVIEPGCVLKAGEIVTLTALPTHGQKVPRVAVPSLDRWVDEDPGRLLRMALAVFNPDMPAAPTAVADWSTMVDSIEPPTDKAADGDPVPVLGLRTLVQHLRSLGLARGAEEGEPALILADNIESCADQFATYRAASRTNEPTAELLSQAERAYRRMARSVESTVIARPSEGTKPWSESTDRSEQQE